jgi:hypothetical protein
VTACRTGGDTYVALPRGPGPAASPATAVVHGIGGQGKCAVVPFALDRGDRSDGHVIFDAGLGSLRHS